MTITTFWANIARLLAQVDQYGTLRNLSTVSTRSILCPGDSAQEETNHKSYLVERYEVAKCHQLLLGETYEESEFQSAVIQGCILKPIPFCPMVGDAIYPTMTMNSVSFDVLMALDLASIILPKFGFISR